MITKYERWLTEKANTSESDWQFFRDWYAELTKEDKQILAIKLAGFEDIGSYFTVVRFDKFLFKNNGKHLFLSNHGLPKFNVEFLNHETAIATLLKLKVINDLKYELNSDQVSIDFYLDNTSLQEILNSYTEG